MAKRSAARHASAPTLQESADALGATNDGAGTPGGDLLDVWKSISALNVPADPAKSITAKVYGRIGLADPPTGRLLGTRKVPAIPGAVVIVRPYKIKKP